MVHTMLATRQRVRRSALAIFWWNASPLPVVRPYHTTRPLPPFRARTSRKAAPTRMPNETRKRSFFGIGEIVGVITNPADTLRSLTEARRMLEEAHQEINDHRERAQIRPSHTFSRLPGFFPRPEEMGAVARALQEEPSFTVLFGASSVGKTALLRQLLTAEKYHVLHFDLRIAGFADLESLYFSLSQQMEQYFDAVADFKGFQEFEKEAWSFKFDRRNVEQRLARGDGHNQVRTSDVARLMELFQSSLLKYRQYVPPSENSEGKPETTSASISAQSGGRTSRWWRFGRPSPATKASAQDPEAQGHSEKKKPCEKPVKRMPVFFLDEAHKLPGLIQSVEAMKVILDSMLVLTKQDRLCHVVFSTSEPFFQTWLRQLNVMQHCKIITIGDCSRLETRSYYERRLVPSIAEARLSIPSFDHLYEAFGGRLVHWQDFITDYINSGGRLKVHNSSHFIQAHALLNLHIIHSSHLGESDDPNLASDQHSARPSARGPSAPSRLGAGNPPGFPIYSPLVGAPDQHAGASSSTLVPSYTPEFTALQLLRVMSRLAQPGVRSLSYFMLCREFGARAIDGMVRGRILDLRWTDPVTNEGEPESVSIARLSRTMRPEGGVYPGSSRTNVMDVGSRSTLMGIQRNMSHNGTIVPNEYSTAREDLPGMDAADDPMVQEEEEESFGPKVLPATPILRYAMASVVAEYEDTGSSSEYASLSDVEEY